MRVGLGLMGVSMWMGLVHTVARVAILWGAVMFPLSSSTVELLVDATAVWMNLLFLIVAVGASIPTTARPLPAGRRGAPYTGSIRSGSTWWKPFRGRACTRLDRV